MTRATSSRAAARARAIALPVRRRSLAPEYFVLLMGLAGALIVGGLVYPAVEDGLAAAALAGIAFVMIVGATAPGLPGPRR